MIFIGIALYLVAVGRGVVRYDGEEEDRTDVTDRLLPHALTILRVSAGATVLVLAFTEKLLNVELGMMFLRRVSGLQRRSGARVRAGSRTSGSSIPLGIIEATAGAALLCGFLPRVVILGLWIPFNLGIAFLPPTELIGHLPILATMYVLLVRGTEGIPPRLADDRAGAAAAARRRAPQPAPNPSCDRRLQSAYRRSQHEVGPSGGAAAPTGVTI